MKLELGFSVLSKRESLLGIQLSVHNGVTAEEDGNLYSERLIELKIGIVFAIITIGFVSLGERLDTPDMDNVKRAMEAFEKELKK